MTLLSRILIVLTLALLGMQGASACEHEHASPSPRAMRMHESMRVVAMHCDASMDTLDTRDAGAPCRHAHSLCCMTMCGVHCSAMLSGAGVPARISSANVPVPRSDPARAGVTRAPPVRPPIV
ncbi:hypothetical protein GCT13_04830 [Paraburkholderia sp. CNPSo 3157]|uniref:Uncharacterized protein n=1 Tax=Paraburkholderia franconis TaxID=2654983 RepID=A0A7X1N6K0_9BURK|nr:hypothetical protein [Paraburkholderia franconis]MPW16270.1 hypothetical protein [Paraburkholderia franconis]